MKKAITTRATSKSQVTSAKNTGKATNANKPVREHSTSVSDQSADFSDSVASEVYEVTSQPLAGTIAKPSNADLAGVIAMMAKLKESFDSSTEKLNTKLDLVLGELSSFKHDLSELKTTVRDIEVSVADTSARIATVETAKLPVLDKKIEEVKNDLHEKLLQYEIHDRKLNLLLYGAPQANKENINDVCFGAFSSILHITKEEAARSIPLVNAHRLPRRNPAGASGPRRNSKEESPDPIIMRFGRMQDRDGILRASQRPRTTERDSTSDGNDSQPRLTIRTDLPPGMKRERGRLASVAYHLRKERHLATRIIVNGTKVILQTRTPSATGPPSPWTAWTESR